MARGRINPQLYEYLSIWGQWRLRRVPELDYPSITPIARLIYAPGRSEGVKQVPKYWPDCDAMHVDNMLKKIPSREHNALWCRYVMNFKDKRAGEAMDCTVYEYRRLFDQAIRQAADALGIKAWIWR